jgi:outer membrane protein assembly factor BamB
MKQKALLAMTLIMYTLAYVSCSSSCQWRDYLGDPHRTAYSSCSGTGIHEELWTVSFNGEFDTPPFIVDDTVLILWKDSASHHWESKVIVLDLLTGEILNEARTDEPVCRIFPVGNQILGITLEVYEINPDSGGTTFLASFPGKTFCGAPQYPLILEDRIIFPTEPAICLSRSDFHTLWNVNDTIAEKDLTATNIAGDETLAVFVMLADEDYQIFAVNPETGFLRWKSTPLPRAHWLALREDTIYCGGERLWAFNRNGSKLWEFAPEGEIESNIVLGPDAVYIADAAHNLYRIDLDGNLIWKTEWEGSSLFRDTHLVGAGDILYYIGNLPDLGAQLTAYWMKNGKKAWGIHLATELMSASPFGLIQGAPAIADSILILGTMDGEVIAFATDPDVFVRQGDTFLSKGLTEKAIESYDKAVELYKKKGNLVQSQKIRTRIYEIENPSASTPPPETAPPSTSPTPETTSPTPESQLPASTPPEPVPESPTTSTIIPFAIAISGILTGIIVYIWRYKRSDHES